MLSQDSGLPNETVCGGTPDDETGPPAGPKFCPYCGHTQFRDVAEWLAGPPDSYGLSDTVELVEYQCESCSNSFWC